MADQLIYTKYSADDPSGQWKQCPDLPIETLIATNTVSIEGDARVTVTEWHTARELVIEGCGPNGDLVIPQGELVRRDVHVNLLRGLSLAGEQATL